VTHYLRYETTFPNNIQELAIITMAQALAEVVEHPNSIAAALRGVGLLYRRQGDIHKAIPVLERSLALSRYSLLFLPVTASLLGAVYALDGRTAETLLLLDQVLDRVATGSHMFAQALVLTELSEALLLVGRVDEANTLTGQLLELSRTHGSGKIRLTITLQSSQALPARLIPKAHLLRDSFEIAL